MNIEEFLTQKGISTDTTIGVEGDFKLTELMEEFAQKRINKYFEDYKNTLDKHNSWHRERLRGVVDFLSICD